MIRQSLTVALPVSLLWIFVTGRITIGSFVVGLLIGLVCVWAFRRAGVRFITRLTLDQLLAIIQYALVLTWDALRSSIQVTRLILRPRLNLRTGIVALRTGDTSPKQKVAALSAHSINMTPGQLVIDFDDRGTLFVHCLDFQAAQRTLEAEQDRRVGFVRRIIGEDTHEQLG